MKLTKISIWGIMALLAGGVQATTLTTSGNWFTAGNWDAGVPTSGTEAVISNSLAATAASSGGAASTVHLSAGGTLTVNSGGAIAVGGTTYAGYVGQGVLNITGGTYTDNALTVCFNNTASGTVNVSGGTYNVGGMIIIGRARNITNAKINVSGGTLNATNQIVYVGYDRLASGVELNVSGGQFISGSLQTRANGLNTSSYAIDISGGAVRSSAWDFSLGLAIGTLDISGSTADIDVSGNLTFGTNVTFNAGLDASGFSTIDVGGTATLGSSTLVVSLLGGATTNDVTGTNILINAASLSGTFASVDLSAFGGSASLVYDTANGNVLLVVAGAGAPPPSSTALTTSGNWFTAGNWNNGVPTSGMDAVISNSLTATVASSGGVASNVYLNGGLTVNTGGAVAVSKDLIGASTGTLTVNGSSANIDISRHMTLASGSTVNAGLDSSGFSTIDVGGTATLGSSTLVVSLLGGATANDVVGTNVLINAASLSGTFASVNLSAFGGSASLVYDTANGNVLLVVTGADPDPALVGTPLKTVNSGLWIDTAVWGGVVPTTNHCAQITDGYIVTNKNGAVAASLLIGLTNSSGMLKISSGGMSLTGGGDFFLAYGPGSYGEIRQTGGAISVSAGRVTHIGGSQAGSTDAEAFYDMDGGTLNGQAVSVGEYGTGLLVIDSDSIVNTTSLTIGNRANSSGFVDVTRQGVLNTASITLGRHAGAYGELYLAGDAAVTSTGGWYVGTNGTGKVEVSGTDVSITLSGPVVLGNNATCSMVLSSNGITSVTAGMNQNITLDGTLEISSTVGAAFPSSVVLFETQGSGVISGTFDQVIWQGLTNIELIYTNSQVRLEKGEEIVSVGSTPLQEVYFGIDAERMTFWKPNWSNEQAQALVDISSNNHVRVAINCAYEREEGVKNLAAYTNDKIFWMMASLTNLNPDIKFFASPRPLFVAYSAEEDAEIWGGTCPWSPYPAWILQFEPIIGDGGVTNGWNPVYLDQAKLTQYFADYLNLMHEYGFKIEYLDLINENDFVTSSNGAYVASHLPALLDEGVEMPELVGPSSWSITAGTTWLNTAPSTFFQYAGVHNSGGDLSMSAMYDFTEAAAARDVDAWNTELHEWVGPGLQSDIVTSAVVWDHFRAGFASIETWLFYGNYEETTLCSMVLAGAWNEGVRTNGKYSIFKKLVQETTGGNYMLTYEPLGLKTAAFKRSNTMTVWVLNPETTNQTTDVKVPGNVSGSVEISRWHTGLSTNLSVTADVSSMTPGSTNRFSYTFQGESLYCLKMGLQ